MQIRLIRKMNVKKLLYWKQSFQESLWDFLNFPLGKRKMPLLIGIMVLGIILIAVNGCTNTLQSPKIELSTNSFDLGDINPDDGNRIETFFIKNVGNAPLNIISVSTSCGCTEAEVESEEIPAGEQTKLTVTYDPSVHPGLVGKIKRIVYIKSNDPLNKEVELELVGNSLPSSKEEYGHVEGDEHSEEEHEKNDHDAGLLKDFEISPFELNKKIENKESLKLVDVREDYEYEESHIKNTLLLSVNKITGEELDKLGLGKDDEIVLYCRSGRRSAKAYEILESLGYKNVKSMMGGLIHWKEEGLPVVKGLNNEQKEIDRTSTSISFDKLEYDFGKIPQFGGIVSTKFEVKNKGDSDLEITSISTSCGCASAELDELVIAPGESSILTVTFDPDFHEEPAGRFSRTVFLETNDPTNPEAEVKIWVDILEGE